MNQLILWAANERAETMHVQLLTTERCGSIAIRDNPISCQTMLRKPSLSDHQTHSDFRLNSGDFWRESRSFLLWPSFLCKCTWQEVVVAVSVFQATLPGINTRRSTRVARQRQAAACGVEMVAGVRESLLCLSLLPFPSFLAPFSMTFLCFYLSFIQLRVSQGSLHARCGECLTCGVDSKTLVAGWFS